jgi:lysophospholipase L1-like esterase
MAIARWSRNAARPFVLIPAAAVLVLTAAAGPAAAESSGEPPGAPKPPGAERPTAVVAMGDSTASGEGGGHYDPASDRFGAWCHRSANAVVALAALRGVDTAVNLGCSGASTKAVRLDGKDWYGEPPQAQQLRSVARSHRIRTVTLTVGANDVPFAALEIHCTSMYYLPGPSCRKHWQRQLPKRLAEIQSDLVGTLTDIRTVLRETGYAEGDYEIVVQTYASPVAKRLRYPYLLRPLHGCPIRDGDAAWAHDHAIHDLNAMMIRAARQVPGVRVLDLSTSFAGREPCAMGISRSEEWINGMFLDLSQLRSGPGPQVLQQALHPNAAGYRHVARCFEQFHATTERYGHCAQTEQGSLRASSGLSQPQLDRLEGR